MKRGILLWAILGALLVAALAPNALAASNAQQSTALVQTVNNPTLGPILVNSQGMTLYTLSSEGTGQFTCTTACVTAWPPLLLPAGATAPTTGPGVTGSLGVRTRPEGTTQATYNGFPLYTFSFDTAAGQTNGEGVSSFGGIWHAAKLTASPAPGPTATPTTAAPPPTVNPSSPLVSTSDNSVLGGILVNQQGMTLYYNTAEEGGKYVCTGKCLGVWGPLTPGSTAPTGAPGVTGTLGVVSRPDGVQQVTYNGVPLYTFVKDTAAGQTNGNGIKALGGTWFAAQIFGTPLSATTIVRLAIHVTTSHHTALGRVSVRYTFAGHSARVTCAAASCTVLLPAGASARIAQVPTNPSTWQFNRWNVHVSGRSAHSRTTPQLSLTVHQDTRVQAVYAASR